MMHRAVIALIFSRSVTSIGVYACGKSAEFFHDCSRALLQQLGLLQEHDLMHQQYLLAAATGFVVAAGLLCAFMHAYLHVCSRCVRVLFTRRHRLSSLHPTCFQFLCSF